MCAEFKRAFVAINHNYGIYVEALITWKLSKFVLEIQMKIISLNASGYASVIDWTLKEDYRFATIDSRLNQSIDIFNSDYVRVNTAHKYSNYWIDFGIISRDE